MKIVDTLPGYSYFWYDEDAPLFYREEKEVPIARGTKFSPPEPGNYYISAKNELTKAESSNRICISVGRTPAGERIDPIMPFSSGEESIKLWFDSSDLDGDEYEDGTIPERGPFKDWKEKTWRNPGTLFTKYEPNKLNGKGVGGFDNVWLQSIGKDVSGYQTIIMVYRESSVSFPGASPFKALNKYIGRSSDTDKRIFDPESIDEKTRKGKTWLNGKRIDPFNTPNPMNFCILCVELESVADDIINRTEGYWEGSIAEIILIDRALTETERKGIDEYLRRKWLSAVDLSFSGN